MLCSCWLHDLLLCHFVCLLSVVCRSKSCQENGQYSCLEVSSHTEEMRPQNLERMAALSQEFKCDVQAITRVIEAQDQLVESAKLGTDKPTAAKS